MSNKQVKGAELIRSHAQQEVGFQQFFTRAEFDVSERFKALVLGSIGSEIIQRVNSVEALHFDVQACAASNCHLCVRLPLKYFFCCISGLGLMKWLLEQQVYHTDGDLLLNGSKNLFYVEMPNENKLLLSITCVTSGEECNDPKWCLDAIVADALAQLRYCDRIFAPDDGIERVPAGKCICKDDPRAKTSFISPGDSDRLLI